MKLHRLTMTGVGPFRGRETIDFDAVSESGLFLIEGPTGAGKSTIIDAISFALYGAVSGEDSDLSRMRSTLCDPGEPSEVCLEFSVAGQRHTLTRNPAYLRPPKKGQGDLVKEPAAQKLQSADGTAMREAKEIGAFIQTVLRMNADQFRRLVVLPQGEFDALLRSSPKERYEVLAKLIDDGYLERVQKDLKDQADRAKQLRAAADATIAALTGQLTARADEVAGEFESPSSNIDSEFNDAEFNSDAHEDVDNPLTPDQLVSRIAGEAERATVAAQRLAEPLAQLRNAELQAREVAKAARTAVEARQRVEDAKEQLSVDDRVADASTLPDRHAYLISQCTRLEPWVEWERAAPQRAAQEDVFAGAVSDAEAQITSAKELVSTFPQRRQDADTALADARVLAGTYQAHAKTVARLEELAQLAARRAAVLKLLDADRTHVDLTGRELQAMRAELQATRNAHNDTLRQQLDQRAAHLAAQLQPGVECPVCGSIEHPAPAALGGAAVLVTDEDVSSAEGAVKVAEAAEQRAQEIDEAARNSLTEHNNQLLGIDAKLGEAPDVAAQLAQAKSELAAALAARDSVNGLEELRDRLSQEEGQSAQELQRLAEAKATAQANLTAFREQSAKEEAALRAEVGADETATELLWTTLQQRDALKAYLDALQQAAGLPVDVDLATAEAQAQQAAVALTDAERRSQAANQRQQRLRDAHIAVTSLLADLHEAQRAAHGLGDDTAAAIALGDMVTGHGNANTRRLTLQAYAVQRRFRSVLEAASVHLEHMSSGKYTFELAEDRSEGLTGLGIAIRDSWDGKTRDPKSMSGGETFYASLSLALGLADVVREEAGGADLQTLFVDEGFGSLDTETLTVVLDQLDALRARGRTVGIISHVTEMKEWVHDRIEVMPSRVPGKGSTIRQE